MIVRGEFSDLLGEIPIDECSPVRHFFAKLRFCKHKVRYEKKTLDETICDIWNKEFDQPEALPLSTEDHLRTMRSEEHTSELQSR